MYCHSYNIGLLWTWSVWTRTIWIVRSQSKIDSLTRKFRGTGGVESVELCIIGKNSCASRPRVAARTASRRLASVESDRLIRTLDNVSTSINHGPPVYRYLDLR